MAKKQKTTTINVNDVHKHVNTTQVKSVNPPQEATRDEFGQYHISRVKAAQLWFSTAKQRREYFLGVGDTELDPKDHINKSTLNTKSNKEKK